MRVAGNWEWGVGRRTVLPEASRRVRNDPPTMYEPPRVRQVSIAISARSPGEKVGRIRRACFRNGFHAARRSSSGQSSNRTATRFDTPDSCMVTP